MQSIILGGGCFWCIETLYQKLNGVHSAISGYAGGHDTAPNYKSVCSGITGHTEVVRVEYDPEVISLREILMVFFTMHNPTTLNRQGADVGTQYRSAIYYENLNDKNIIDSAIKEAQSLWSDPIVTEVLQGQEFYPAEEYHQKYYDNNPNQSYCNIVIQPKVAKFRKQFSHLLKAVAMSVLLLFSFSSYSQLNLDFSVPEYHLPPVSGVPTLRVNFYLMNAAVEVNDSITAFIGSNMVYLNEEFEGWVKFELNEIYLDEYEPDLVVLHEDYFYSDSKQIQDMAAPIEKPGSISIFVCGSQEDENGNALMGFTPVLTAKQYAYAINSPRFDRIFISYDGLEYQTTLVHEMGHFLGLRHPWQMILSNKRLLGLTSEEIVEHNHMSYGPNVREFTTEQLERMQHYANQFRRYLAVKIESPIEK